MIKGKNPSRDIMLAELGEFQYRIIAYQESKLNQFAQNGNILFNQNPDYPYQGRTSDDRNGDDFGIMQINKPQNDDIIWNWTKNIVAGKAKFNEKYRLAGNYYSDIQNGTTKVYDEDADEWTCNDPNPNDDQGNRDKWYYADSSAHNPIKFNAQPMTADQQMSEAFQRYNGGTYWKWIPDDKQNPQGTGKWLAYPPLPHEGHTLTYGDECWRLWTQNPPPDWK